MPFLLSRFLTEELLVGGRDEEGEEEDEEEDEEASGGEDSSLGCPRFLGWIGPEVGFLPVW